MFLNQFQRIGGFLFNRGLVSSQTGNLSIRVDNKLIITRWGSNLGSLEEKDLIETGITQNARSTSLASVELPVHRAIYLNTQARAVVHAHPPYTTALSVTEKMIYSDVVEDFSVLGKVPVIGWGMEVKRGGLADVISETLKHERIVVVRGHGTFAVGQLLEDAYNTSQCLEQACKIMCLMKCMQVKNEPGLA